MQHDKIKAFALKVRTAKTLERHGIAATLLNGSWHRWRDFAPQKGTWVFTMFKEAAKYGLLKTRPNNPAGRGAPFTEYRATPELEKALKWPKETARLVNPATYAIFCALREEGEMSPAALAQVVESRDAGVRTLLKRLVGFVSAYGEMYFITEPGLLFLEDMERAAGATIENKTLTND